MSTDNNRFPGLNFNTPITITDYDYLQNNIYNEITKRTKAIFGVYLSAGYHGILSSTNPTTTQANTTPVMPLQVDFLNATDLTSNDLSTINVHPGQAFTKEGNLIELNDIYTVRLLEGITATQGQNLFVIYAEYEIINDTSTNVITRSGLIGSKRTLKNSPIKYTTYTTWLNPTVFTETRLNNIVPIALVTFMYTEDPISSTSAFIYKEIDHTNSNLNANRPWFSAIDIEHRNFIGSGSHNIPHALGLNDLSTGDIPIYTQLITQNAVVFAKAKDVINCPGTLCYEDISSNAILTDTTGNTTGKIGAKYLKLAKYPHKILGYVGPYINVTDDDNCDLALSHLPGTNILVLADNESWIIVPVRIWYTHVSAYAPNPETLMTGGTTLHLVAPGDSEIPIAEGKAITNVGTTKLDFSAYTLFPQKFKVYVTGTGNLITSPQNIVCTQKLTNVGTTLQQNSNALITNAKLKIGVYTDQDPLYFKIKLIGKDANNNSITEELTIRYDSTNPTISCVKPTASTGAWSPIPADAGTPPGYNIKEIDAPSYIHITGTTYKSNDYTSYYTSGDSNFGNFLYTANTFSELTSWQLTTNPSSLGNTYIQISADLDSYNSTTIRDYLYIADILWNGSQITHLYDRRTIKQELIMERSKSPAMIKSVDHTLNYDVLFIEDYLSDPYHMDYNKSHINYLCINNVVPTFNTYDNNYYTTKALPVDENMIIATGTNANAAYLVIYTEQYQNINIFNQNNNNPIVLWRNASATTPLSWTPWTLASPSTYSGETNRLVFDITDAFTCTLVNRIIKNQFKILGNFYGFAIYLTHN